MTAAEAIARMSESAREAYEERCGILEYCAHLPRAQAEVMALMMMRRNSYPLRDGRGLCGGQEHASDVR